MDESMLMEAKPEGSLMHFTRSLIERGDFSKLGPEPVTILLAINHYYGEAHLDKFEGIPEIEYLIDLTGLDLDALNRGLEILYRNGYLNRESYWSDGESKTLYKVRERHWLYDNRGEKLGEVSWDKQFPSTIFGLSEFRNILASKDIGDAKYIHIEKLQVNIGNPFEDKKREEHIDVSSASEYDEKTLITGIQKSNAEKKQATADTKINQESNIKHKNSSSLPKLHKQYTDRLYREFASALEAIEIELETAFRDKINNENKKPQQPIGLALLVNSRRWQSNLEQWQNTQKRLDKQYDSCIKERQRLLKAMKPNDEGGQPLYIQEAVTQLKQDYPELSDAIDRRYSSVS